MADTDRVEGERAVIARSMKSERLVTDRARRVRLDTQQMSEQRRTEMFTYVPESGE
jgi:hypothetical protein